MSHAMGRFGNDGRFKPAIGFGCTGSIISSEAAKLAKIFEATLSTACDAHAFGGDIISVAPPAQPLPPKCAQLPVKAVEAKAEEVSSEVSSNAVASGVETETLAADPDQKVQEVPAPEQKAKAKEKHVKKARPAATEEKQPSEEVFPMWMLWIVPVKSLSQISALEEIEPMSKKLRKVEAGWVVGNCSVTMANKIRQGCVGIVVSGKFAENSKDLKIGSFMDAGDYVKLQTPKS